MGRLLTVAYGAISYALFLAAFLYAVGFVTNLAVPRSLDGGGPMAGIGEALLIDILLLGLFAVQHSVMARPAFKHWWTRFVPWNVERSTYVLASSAVLFLLCWQWRPMPEILWNVTGAAGTALQALGWLGWLTVLASTFMINHFELFGLQQVYRAWRGEPAAHPEFRSPLLYRLVRHPIMLGFLVAFWATPVMTVGHLLFSVATTGYILIALQLEERDLVAALGDPYRQYQARVPMLLPWPRPKPPS